MTLCSSSVGNVYVGRLFSYWTSGSANMSSDCKIDDADSNSIHASPAAACKETCGRERLIGCTCAGIVRTGPEHDQLMERTLTWAWQRSMGNSCEAHQTPSVDRANTESLLKRQSNYFVNQYLLWHKTSQLNMYSVSLSVQSSDYIYWP